MLSLIIKPFYGDENVRQIKKIKNGYIIKLYNPFQGIDIDDSKFKFVGEINDTHECYCYNNGIEEFWLFRTEMNSGELCFKLSTTKPKGIVYYNY